MLKNNFVQYLSVVLMCTSAAAQTPFYPCLQPCKDACYLDKDCASFKKPANCIKRCDDRCDDRVAKNGCGATDAPTATPTAAPTPEPTKAPLAGVPACLGPCVSDCESDKGCSPGDVKCNRRCTDQCLKVYDRKGCPGPTASPTAAPQKSVPACMLPCVADCEDKKDCANKGKKSGKCTKRCVKKCNKRYKKKGCPKTPKPTSSPTASPTTSPTPKPTAAPYTSPPVLGVFACDTLVSSGGQMTQDYRIIFTGATKGTISIYYQMFTIPDSLDVFYEGNLIFTTGGLVSGTQTVTRMIDGNDNFAIARLAAPLPNTGWRFTIGCVGS